MERRRFLKIFGVGAVAVPVAAKVVSSLVPEEKPVYQGIMSQIEQGNQEDYYILTGSEFAKELDEVLKLIG